MINNFLTDWDQYTKENIKFSKITQFTIDLLEDFYNEIYLPHNDNEFKTLIGSYVYKFDNILEIIDKALYDFSIIKDANEFIKKKYKEMQND